MKFLIKYKEFDSEHETVIYASSEDYAVEILKNDLGFISILSIVKCPE